MSATVQAPGPVLVGVDGSTRNASAVAWAAAEAVSSSAPLVLVHDDGGAGEAAGRATLERAAAEVARVDRRLRPAIQVLTAHGAAAGLVRTARELEQAEQQNSGHAGAWSATVVVGRRGSGGFRAMSLGSTARLLAHEDGPPTVIVPSGWDSATVEPSAPVVVDARHAAGQAGGRALGAAMARAHREQRPVVAVSVWSVPGEQALAGGSIAQVWSEHADRAERELEQLLRPWRTAYPSVKVAAVATDRHPVAALLDQASGSELLVVPRGPTASAVVEYAECPVVVV